MRTLLDNSGRIQLPAFVQAHLGVKPGDELALEEENGNWLIKPTRLPTAVQPPCSNPPAKYDDDLNWEELDYASVPLKHASEVTVHIKRRGRLKPMAHDLVEE